jgi:uncharacterized protein DUF397
MMVGDALDPWREVEFRKSSLSGGANSSCVEVAWRTPSLGDGEDNGRVEVARGETLFGIRDSKNVAGPVLNLGTAGRLAFLAAVTRVG